MIISLSLLFLSLIGALDTAYLSFLHLFESGSCGSGTGCGDVLSSPYASVSGVPLSTLGLGFYLAVGIVVWRSLRDEVRSESLRWTSLLGAIGTLLSLYLVYLQAFVIDAWCPYCLLSAFTTVSILTVSLLARKHRRELNPLVGSLVSRDLIPVLLVMVTPSLVYGQLERHIPSTMGAAREIPQEVVATIGDREITAAEMDQAIQLKLYEQKQELRKEWLDRQLLEEAARGRNMDTRELVRTDVHRKIKVTQKEIEKRYEEIKGRLPKNVSKEMVTNNIRGELGNRKSQGALDTYVDSLRKKFGTVYTTPTSEQFFLDPNPRGGPVKGNPNAPVTIVEYSDLECGYCSRAHGYLSDLVKRRSQDVRVIFKHLPLNMHKHARHAAAAAACAHKQGKFWELADILFREQKQLGEDKVRIYAEQAELDQERFRKCLGSGAGMNDVAADVAEADALGVSSTPTFFINGRYIGSLPKDGLDKLIDIELAR